MFWQNVSQLFHTILPKMGYSAQLFQRADYTKKDGANPIYLRIIINRKKKDYFLNISVL